jgi:hypothetical protein
MYIHTNDKGGGGGAVRKAVVDKFQMERLLSTILECCYAILCLVSECCLLVYSAICPMESMVVAALL